MWLAKHVDLIFVFMDPVGQALCTRTMNVVKALDVREPAAWGGSSDHSPYVLDLTFPLVTPDPPPIGTRAQNARYGGKMKFFITKADQVPRALDLQNIITQTVAVRRAARHAVS